jgi:hypothetical protein|tara:strand:+ start:498 stop:797 length:300 start_codon:yes stop_codon:yes gene_type:complete
MDIAQAINDFGFPVVLCVGLGYFIYYIWWFIGEKIDPALSDMHIALIRVIDKMRRLDQDLIRLQQKVDVVLEYRARQQVLDNAEQKTALKTLKQKQTGK